MAKSISQRTEKLNHISRLIAEYASEPEEKLVKFCLSERYTVTDISTALGISSTALKKKYPHLIPYSKEARI